MSTPTDPPDGPPTTPMLAPVPEAEGDLVIPRGQARAAVVLALADLARSVGHVEELMSAMARGLDASEEGGGRE